MPDRRTSACRPEFIAAARVGLAADAGGARSLEAAVECIVCARRDRIETLRAPEMDLVDLAKTGANKPGNRQMRGCPSKGVRHGRSREAEQQSPPALGNGRGRAGSIHW